MRNKGDNKVNTNIIASIAYSMFMFMRLRKKKYPLDIQMSKSDSLCTVNVKALKKKNKCGSKSIGLCLSTIPVKKGPKVHGMSTVILPKGSIMYRGHKLGEGMPNTPLFYTTFEHAMMYAHSHKGRCNVYYVQTPVLLLDLWEPVTLRTLEKHFKKSKHWELFSIFTGIGRTSLEKDWVACKYKGKSKNAAKYCAVGFMSDDDRLAGNYISKKMLMVLHEMFPEVQGWISPVIPEGTSSGKCSQSIMEISIVHPRDHLIKVKDTCTDVYHGIV
jgi:hypothetical protein